MTEHSEPSQDAPGSALNAIARSPTIPYLVLAILVSIPVWIVRYPPIEDLPYQVATIRVLHSLHDPAFGLQDNFQLTLGRTQYLLYYALGSLLAYVVDVRIANLILISLYLGGTVLALRALLLELRGDPRISLLAVPLLYNSIFMLGLFPFLLGVPLLFLGLAISLRHFHAPTAGSGILLGVISLALFLAHIVPWGLFMIGFLALFPWRGTMRHRLERLAGPLLPSLAFAGWWAFFTTAGRITREAAAHPAQVAPVSTLLESAYRWTGDIFRDQSDERIFACLGVLVLLTVVSMVIRRDPEHRIALPLIALPLACSYFYLRSGEGYSFIWPLGPRFAFLAGLTTLPLLRFPRGRLGRSLVAAAALLAVATTANVSVHFLRFQQTEVGDFDGALASIPPRQHVAALIYDKFSRIAQWTPFLHFGSYYQAEKGGVVEFTFAGYPHWPFDFLPGKYPPPGGPARPRWEWTPEQVPVLTELLPYYDYVLVRGSDFFPPPGTYKPAWVGRRWSVWRRVATP